MALHVLLHRTIYARHKPESHIQVLFYILIGVTAAWGILAAVVFSRLPLLLMLLNTAYVIAVGFCLGYCYFHVLASERDRPPYPVPPETLPRPERGRRRRGKAGRPRTTIPARCSR